MTPLAYYEDQQKLKSHAIKNIIIGPIVILLGILIYSVLKSLVSPGNFSTFAYMMAGFRGAIAGAFIMVGGLFLVMGINLFLKAGKSPITLISANEKGVTLSIINEKWAQQQFISWHDIRDIQPMQKNNKSCIMFALHNPEAFINAVPSKQQALLKKNMSAYNSPAVVVTDFCAVPNEQIGNELSRFLN